MKRWVGYVAQTLSLAVLVSPIHVGAISGPVDCELCVIEVQTQGVSDATEEYIIVANLSAQTKTGIIIQYLSAAGTKGSKATIDLPSASITSLVSPVLKTANSINTNNWPAGMSSTSGTVQIIDQGSVVDQIGWGAATVREGNTVVAHGKGQSLARKQSDIGQFIDTGNNNEDFQIDTHACSGLVLNEIQPLLLDNDGNDIDQALEILKPNGAVTDQDCPLLINGTRYSIAAGDLQDNTGVAVITAVLDSQDAVVTLPVLTNAPNTFQFMPQSLFGAINLPAASLTQPVLITGQSYAKFTSGLKATYTPTIGITPNQATTAPPPIITLTQIEDDCADVLINELTPNPIGEDTGQEWIEFISIRNTPVFLANCVLVVNNTQYIFADDQVINPSDFSVLKGVSDGVTVHTLSLKNSATNTISFGRFSANDVFEPLQTIQYVDAPEGQSWARFDNGWRWLTPPTPGTDNITPPSNFPVLIPTEFPALASSDTPGLGGETPAKLSPQIIITELLPNPSPPSTDENDEFVELYNPGIDAVDLDGYKVQTGSNYSYSFTIDNQTILAGGYLVLTSGGTGLTLANTAGRARLLDPVGNVISETDPYEDADEGATWALINGIWQWTNTPTSGNANVFTAVLAVAKTTKKASAKTTTAKPKVSSAKAKTTKKAKKVKAAKAPKTKKVTAAANASSLTNTTQTSSLHPGVLVLVGGLALVYAAYEYRHDFANTLYKFRRNRAARRAARL